MSARGKARKRALDVLYEAELRAVPALTTLADRGRRAGQSDEPPVPPYAVELVEGVVANQARIDALISAHSEGWTIERMPAVDRNVLRIGTYELLFRDDVPAAVAISEAVELAAQLSTDESPRFVNGLLSRLTQAGTTSDPV